MGPKAAQEGGTNTRLASTGGVISTTGVSGLTLGGGSRDDQGLQAGAPGNGKPFPDGAKIVKIHWNAKKECGGPRSDDEGAGYPARRWFHREG